VYTASADEISHFDLRATEGVIVQSPTASLFNNGGTDINCIDMDDTGSMLVAADDNGAVHVCDLTAFQAGSGSDSGGYTSSHREPHTALVNSVLCGVSTDSFYSGGFDSLLCCWDRSRDRGVRPLKQHLITSDELLATTLGATSAGEQARQCINPPFIHQLQYVLPNRAGLACAVGDGDIKIYACNENRGASKASGTEDDTALDNSEMCANELRLLCHAPVAHDGMVTALTALGPHRNTLLSTGVDGLVRTWRVGYDEDATAREMQKPVSASAARRQRRNKARTSGPPSVHSHPVVMQPGAVLAHGRKINMLAGGEGGDGRFFIADLSPAIASCVFT